MYICIIMKTTSRRILPKKNSLKSTKVIDKLFIEGKSIIAYPVRLVYLQVAELPHKYEVSFSVPKKKFKLAVSRNRIKRLMRESFRQQQHKLKKENIAMMWLYLNHKMPQKYF